MTLNILVGADPEVFVRKVGRKSFTSAHGLVAGNKKNPLKVEKGAVQVDGMALEFNIDPAKNQEEFIGNLKHVMKLLGEMVPDYELVPTPVATFTAAHMKAQPAEAVELGCEPDFCGWNDGAANPRPNGDVNFRTGAGHVHIGWTQDMDINDVGHREACIMLSKQLDYYLGLGSLVYDSDTKRRTLYGSAGAYRPKSYGMEYRVLSNAWLQDEALMGWVYRMTIKAVKDLYEGKAAFNYWGDIVTNYLKRANPKHTDIYHIMQQVGVECPPGFKYFHGKGFVKV